MLLVAAVLFSIARERSIPRVHYASRRPGPRMCLRHSCPVTTIPDKQRRDDQRYADDLPLVRNEQLLA
jgi:hypothetical protein